jgi:hypothetical protein
MPDKPRVHRELCNLISSINYEGLKALLPMGGL